ncbi:F1U1 [Hyposoter didymator ichnovirus]|nr:F1U1 [Hyposoter didymator ichnovirus]
MPGAYRIFIGTKFVLPVGSCNSYILIISKTPNARLQPTYNLLYRIHRGQGKLQKTLPIQPVAWLKFSGGNASTSTRGYQGQLARNLLTYEENHPREIQRAVHDRLRR